MFINVYQRLSTFINVSGGFIQVQFQQIVVPFEDGFISVVDPPKTRSITDIFEPILGVFQQPLATPIVFFFKSHLREIRVRSCNLLLQARMDALMAVWAKTPMYVLPEK